MQREKLEKTTIFRITIWEGENIIAPENSTVYYEINGVVLYFLIKTDDLKEFTIKLTDLRQNIKQKNEEKTEVASRYSVKYSCIHNWNSPLRSIECKRKLEELNGIRPVQIQLDKLRKAETFTICIWEGEKIIAPENSTVFYEINNVDIYYLIKMDDFKEFTIKVTDQRYLNYLQSGK
jgi:hypothetical protein